MIEQIKEALEKATPGPWEWIADGVCLFPKKGQDYGDYILFIQKSADLRSEDAHLIANTPTYIRYLLDELEKATAEIQNQVRRNDEHRQKNDRLQTEHTAMKDVIHQALTSLQMEQPMSAESVLEEFVSTLTKEESHE